MTDTFEFAISVHQCPDTHPNKQLHNKWLTLLINTTTDEFVEGRYFDTEQEAIEFGNWIKENMLAQGGEDISVRH